MIWFALGIESKFHAWATALVDYPVAVPLNS